MLAPTTRAKPAQMGQSRNGRSKARRQEGPELKDPSSPILRGAQFPIK